LRLAQPRTASRLGDQFRDVSVNAFLLEGGPRRRIIADVPISEGVKRVR
jgi:hypothetical protein